MRKVFRSWRKLSKERMTDLAGSLVMSSRPPGQLQKRPNDQTWNAGVAVRIHKISDTMFVQWKYHTHTHTPHTHTHTNTHTFNSPFSRTTRVSRYQKGKTNLDFTAARDSEWRWHQLGHMQVCTSLQTDNVTHHHSVFYRPDALPATQPTASKHWRHSALKISLSMKIPTDNNAK